MIVLGHRGIHDRTHSENTIESLEEAIRRGADGIEFDLRASKDGEIVVIHDANLHRVAGDAHRIAELTAAELAQTVLRSGGTIPTLHDVTSQIFAPAVLDMEIKHRDVIDLLIAKLNTSAGLRERTIVSSFHATALLRIRRACPGVRILFLAMRWPLPLRGRPFWARLERLKPWGVGFPEYSLTRHRVRKLQSRGFNVAAWDRLGTVREARRIKSLNPDIAIVHHVNEMRIPQ